MRASVSSRVKSCCGSLRSEVKPNFRSERQAGCGDLSALQNPTDMLRQPGMFGLTKVESLAGTFEEAGLLGLFAFFSLIVLFLGDRTLHRVPFLFILYPHKLLPLPQLHTSNRTAPVSSPEGCRDAPFSDSHGNLLQRQRFDIF